MNAELEMLSAARVGGEIQEYDRNKAKPLLLAQAKTAAEAQRHFARIRR
ncbi:hypothetical protein I6F26_00785 [Ensifer sp. IC3342]|nr:hypothetical protein [Ensifer sp. BRP08]MCA1445125.1 hypothetical protein [Ensifer sp. IC3342]